MNLFRSEEHAARYDEAHGYGEGATIPVSTLAELAVAWWGTRLASDWRPRSRDESQAILERVGLTGDFWRLPASY